MAFCTGNGIWAARTPSNTPCMFVWRLICEDCCAARRMAIRRAAVTGNDRFREGAARIFTTGSFWTASVSMAAAIATIRKLRDTEAIAHMRAMGQRLRDGLDAQAKRHGLALRQSGPVQMPVVLFDDDADRRIGNAFCQEALARGVYLHPAHTMFMSAAHQQADIDTALAATDEAMAAVARR